MSAAPPAPFADADVFACAPQHDTAFAFITVLPSGATPTTLKQAFASVDARHWRFATGAEFEQLEAAHTWELVSASEAKNVISGKWVFRIKKGPTGEIVRYKARWVARGFSQKHGVDFTEIFAPTIRYSSLRMLLALANYHNLNIYGLDVSNAFARSDITDHDLFVKQPTGYEKLDSEGRPYVCKLKKGLYGTKQAARLWNIKFRNFLLQRGWRQYESDPCLFSRHTSRHGHEIIGVYVDDICHVCASPKAHTALLTACNSVFPTTSQGELTWILGMHIKRNRHTRTLSLDQSQSIHDFLVASKFDFASSSAPTPMHEKWRYGSEPPIDDEAIISQYRSQVGSLNFFATTVRADIAFSVHALCRYLTRPNSQCLLAVQRLQSYLSGTLALGLVYQPSADQDLSFEAYCDANWGSDESPKSVSGSVIFFAGGPIDWSSKLQSVVALSSAESEHISAFNASRSIVYYRQFLEELGHAMFQPTTLWVDNKAAIAQSKNPVNHKTVKHMLLKYHYLRDLVSDRQVQLQYVSTIDQLADVFTKPLSRSIFTRLVPFIVRPTL